VVCGFQTHRFYIIITDEYDLGGTVALLLQDHWTTLQC